jgi:hypothetical protein
MKSTSYPATLFTSHGFTVSQTCFFQKDELALPGSLQSKKQICTPPPHKIHCQSVLPRYFSLSVTVFVFSFFALSYSQENRSWHFINGSTALVDLGRIFSFSLDGGSARRKAAAYTQNKRTQASMPRLGFEPTIPAFVRAYTVHALDSAATEIGEVGIHELKIQRQLQIRCYYMHTSPDLCICGSSCCSSSACSVGSCSRQPCQHLTEWAIRILVTLLFRVKWTDVPPHTLHALNRSI